MSEHLCVNCGLPITTNACRWRGSKKIKHEPVEDCFPLVRAEIARLRERILLYESLQESDRYPSQTWRASVVPEDKREAKEGGDDE